MLLSLSWNYYWSSWVSVTDVNLITSLSSCLRFCTKLWLLSYMIGVTSEEAYTSENCYINLLFSVVFFVCYFFKFWPGHWWQFLIFSFIQSKLSSVVMVIEKRSRAEKNIFLKQVYDYLLSTELWPLPLIHFIHES